MEYLIIVQIHQYRITIKKCNLAQNISILGTYYGYFQAIRISKHDEMNGENIRFNVYVRYLFWHEFGLQNFRYCNTFQMHHCMCSLANDIRTVL